MLSYLSTLSWQRTVLWCYLCWYAVVVALYFDGSPALWLSSLGISAIIGTALMLSVCDPGRPRPGGWTVFRLFLMPFCVSSYSGLIKGRGFLLIFPPDMRHALAATGACVLLVLARAACRRAPEDGTMSS